MKLSILICLYNTDKTLFENTLRSIFFGTLSLKDDFEVCVYDDGSCCDYSDVISKYPVKYKKGENRGIFSARLSAIEMAEGEYIAFVDSDDTVSFNYHRPMLMRAEKTGADIVINDWAFHSERTKYYCKGDSTVKCDMDLLGDDILRAFMAQEGREHSFFVLWNKMFRRELLHSVAVQCAPIANNPARFNYSEDTLMSFYAFMGAKRVVNLHTGYYFYRIHQNQTVNVVSKEQLVRHIDCMAQTLTIMKDELTAHGREELIPSLVRWSALMSRTHYSYAKSGGYRDLYPVIKEKYGVSRLRGTTLRDGAVYSSVALLGENFDEIDRTLMQICHSEQPVEVSVDGKQDYALRSIDSLVSMGYEIKLLKDGGLIIPREKIRIKNRIIMNPFVYKLGMLLFPKGSKIRAALKKKV